MKSKYTSISIAITVMLIFSMNYLTFLPWWSFCILIFFFGVYTSYKKWFIHCFIIGFFAGFLTWICSNLYYDFSNNGLILNRIGGLVPGGKLILLFLSGLTGGLLSGLSFYGGSKILK